MIGNRKVNVIILAKRSNRVKDKNIRMIAGKPMYKWILDECEKSLYIDDIYISTSDKEYEQIFKKEKCIVLNRPLELSAPNVNSIKVIKYECQNIDCDNKDYIVHLDFTKPLTSYKTIDECIKFIYDGKLDSVFTVKELKENLLGDKAVVSQLKKEKRYIYFGACRIRTKETCLNMDETTWGYGNKHYDLSIIRPFEIDVDYEYQFIIAEALLNAGYKWRNE